MDVIAGADPLPEHLRGAVIAIGNFDGMHRGHQQLLALARDLAKAEARPWGVVTFEPHPRTFFSPAEPVFRITPPALKARLAAAQGADFLAAIPFDTTLAMLAADDFVRQHLVQRLGAAHVVTGYDFHFGKGRKGSPETLAANGKAHGFGVTIVDQVADEAGGAPFSSSSIRAALRHGHVRNAARELGYHWLVLGEVVKGDQRGHTLGFPTANIILDPGVELYRGIYAVFARDAEAAPGTGSWRGAAYFGDRPTFMTGRSFLEVHMLDDNPALYGRRLLVSFVDLVRRDQSFASVADLLAQITADCAVARTILADEQANPGLAEFPLARLQAAGLL